MLYLFLNTPCKTKCSNSSMNTNRADKSATLLRLHLRLRLRARSNSGVVTCRYVPIPSLHANHILCHNHSLSKKRKTGGENTYVQLLFSLYLEIAIGTQFVIAHTKYIRLHSRHIHAYTHIPTKAESNIHDPAEASAKSKLKKKSELFTFFWFACATIQKPRAIQSHIVRGT